jgi:hypothetical protein
MSITIIGIIVVTVVVFAAIKKPEKLISLAIFFAPFQGASVFNIGFISSSITPYYFVLSIISILSLGSFLSRLVKRRPLAINQSNYTKLFTLLSYIIIPWSSFSLFFPFIFEGFGVYIPNEGIDNTIQSLHFSVSNIAQLIYLIENLVFIRYFFVRNSMRQEHFKNLLLSSGALISFIGLWRISGFMYPEDIINNGLKSGVQQGTEIGITRLAATLPEPSYAGAFLAPLIVLSILSFFGFKQVIYILTTLLFSTALLLTFSSVGFIATGIFLPLIVLVAAKTSFLKKGMINKIIFLVFLLCFLVFFAILFKNEVFVAIINNVIFGKVDSTSAINRSSSDLYSLGLFWETYGLGVGIGSNRPSSFFAWLASNLGLPGILFFLICLTAPLLQYSNTRKKNLFFLVYYTNLLCMMIAIPDLTWPYLWIYIGLLSI